MVKFLGNIETTPPINFYTLQETLILSEIPSCSSIPPTIEPTNLDPISVSNLQNPSIQPTVYPATASSTSSNFETPPPPTKTTVLSSVVPAKASVKS